MAEFFYLTRSMDILRLTRIPVMMACAEILLLAGCGASGRSNFPSPPQYDLNHPYKINLPEQLREISGLEYYPKDTSIFSIADNDGWLFKIFLKRNIGVQKWKFGKSHDYEDLQLVDSLFYVLSSSGDITRIRFYRNDGSLHTDNFKFRGGGKNEFESLYYDKPGNALILLCKNCESDNNTAVSSWRFNLANGTYEPAPQKLDVTPIAKTLNENKLRFKASATAIHPITHDLYILSSVNKALVIADSSGKVKETYPLDPAIYKQPEGMAFTPAGDLLISNEVNMGEYPTLLVFKNKIHGK